MAFNYLKSHRKSIFRALKPKFKTGMLYIRPEDLKIGMRTSLMWDTPWIHAGGEAPPERNCVLFHSLMLHHCNFIPAKCQNCWKVVAKPETVSQLFKISELQQLSKRHSKAGIEIRETVGGNYGAYWYNDSIEEGEECRQYVRNLCDEHLSPDVEVFLKRGCTEFEHKFGASNKWEVTEEAREIEQLIVENIVVEDNADRSQPWYLVDDVKQKWVEFAYERGDVTYLEFTDGKPLYPKYVTYTSEEK